MNKSITFVCECANFKIENPVVKMSITLADQKFTLLAYLWHKGRSPRDPPKKRGLCFLI